MKLNAVEYDWNEKYDQYEFFKERKKLHAIGLIAQEVRKDYPEIVYMQKNGYYSIDYSKLNAVLVEAIKDHQIYIDDINKQIEELEKNI